jgi:hypothetical protein
VFEIARLVSKRRKREIEEAELVFARDFSFVMSGLFSETTELKIGKLGWGREAYSAWLLLFQYSG